MLRKVAAVVFDGVAPFELGVLCEAFGIDRSGQGLATFDFSLCALRPGPVRTSIGFDIMVQDGLGKLAEADLIGIPAVPRDATATPREPQLEELTSALRAAVDRGARVLSVCSGAFVLGAAGLLDGRRCTTHWMYAEELARRYPLATVDAGVLYVEDGPVISSAGTAAGIDTCLHLLRQEHGVAVANDIARRMVVPPHRDGGQAQYIDPAHEPIVPTDDLALLLDWMQEHLHEDLTVADLAGQAAMSERTFARRFKECTGTTPHRWLQTQRLHRAQELLERTDLDVERIADRSGFGTGANLRQHFRRELGTTPTRYRTTFRGTAA